MSKIAKKPVEIVEGAQVILEEGSVKVSGTKGNLMFKIPQGVGVRIEEGNVLISQTEN
jgi:ribosomal protein L6P/L9E